MEIITSYNPRGGVGKSTSAINFAAINAEKAKTLYIDLDFYRGGSMMLNLAEQKSYDEDKTSALLFSEKPSKASDLAVPSSFGFDFIPSGHEMAHCEKALSSDPGALMHLAIHFQEDEALREYDKIFLDCGGPGDKLKHAILFACTGVLVPVDAISQIDDIFKEVNVIKKLQVQAGRQPLEILGVFLARLYKQAKKAADEVTEKIANDPLAIPYFIPEGVLSSEEQEKAVLAGRPIVQNNPKHAMSESYRHLYEAIWGGDDLVIRFDRDGEQSHGLAVASLSESMGESR